MVADTVGENWDLRGFNVEPVIKYDITDELRLSISSTFVFFT